MTANLQQTAERIKSLGLHKCMYKRHSGSAEACPLGSSALLSQTTTCGRETAPRYFHGQITELIPCSVLNEPDGPKKITGILSSQKRDSLMVCCESRLVCLAWAPMVDRYRTASRQPSAQRPATQSTLRMPQAKPGAESMLDAGWMKQHPHHAVPATHLGKKLRWSGVCT